MEGRGDFMHEIRPRLWLGSANAEQSSFEFLNKIGITHIVQVGSGEMMRPTHKGLEYCCIQALDHEGEDLLIKLKAAKAHHFMDIGLQQGRGVLVHCFAGVSRSATCVISYLMARESLSFEPALTEVMSKRPQIAPNRGFCDQLRILQDHCAGNLDRYTSEMWSADDEGMSFKQWLGMLTRCRERGNPYNSLQANVREAYPLTLKTFRDRLEERKQLGRSGVYRGHPPPNLPSNGFEDDSHLPAKSDSEEYALGLS